MPLIRRRALAKKLVKHLRNIGVEAQYEEGERVNLGTSLVDFIREVFADDKFSVKLADIRVRLRQIHSIEVWRDTWMEDRVIEGRKTKVSMSKNNVYYVTVFEPGVILPMGIQASIITKRTIWRKIKSFEWNAFPALVSKLGADESLSSKLLRHFGKDLPVDLSIGRYSNDRVSIRTSYNPRSLPSREALRCLEDIALRVSDFVSEWNRNSEVEIER